MTSSPSIGRRIRDVRKRLGLTQAKLAQKLGVQPISVSSWECGRNDPWNNIERLSQVLNVTTDWLIAGAEKERPKRTVKILGYAAAGGGALNEDVDDLGEAELPPLEGVDFAVRVNGDSMEPLIRSGDVILCEKRELHLPPIENDDALVQVPMREVEPFKGKIVIALVNNESYVKRCEVEARMSPGAYWVRLASVNPFGRDRKIGRDDDVRIKGVSIGLWRPTP